MRRRGDEATERRRDPDSGTGFQPVISPEPPTEHEKLHILRAYFDLMRRHRDDRYAMFRIQQKISWLGKTINGSHCHALKEGIRTAKTPGEVHAAIDAWEREMQASPAPA